MKKIETKAQREFREIREAGERCRKRMQKARVSSYRELRSRDTGRDPEEVR